MPELKYGGLLSGSVLFLAGLFGSETSFAIVSMEKLHFKQHQSGTSGAIKLSTNLTGGNSETERYTVDVQTQWHRPEFINLLLLGYDYGISSGVRNINKRFIHLRHIHRINDDLAWEAFGQLEQNEFTRLSYRRLFGTGARFEIAPSDRNQAYLGAGAMQVEESIHTQTGYTDDGIFNTIRANFYLLWRLQASKNYSLGSALYYQPNISQLDDFRVLFDASIKSVLTSNTSLTISYELEQASQPPQGIKPVDTTFKAGITYKY